MSDQKFTAVKDSGSRQEFNTGSVRDTCEGKGLPHLVAGEAIRVAQDYGPDGLSALKVLEFTLLDYSELAEGREDNMELLYAALRQAIVVIKETENGSYAGAMKRLANHYANGAKKYAKNNWRKGQPVSRYYDSAMRHTWAAIDGDVSEDHRAAILWNIVGMIQTKIDVERGILPKELNDFPCTLAEVFPQKVDDGQAKN